jgi:peptidoglycan/LPS O-acetylase OafA/YrhL
MNLSTATPRVAGLDGLRAIAAAFVLGHHLGGSGLRDALVGRGHPVVGFFAGTLGASGVELFFVLSAVVLARPYVRRGRPMLLIPYVQRRAQRLFPPYAVAWLLGGAAIYFLTVHTTWYSQNAGFPKFSWHGWLMQLGILYFGDHYSPAWWSLAVEVMFYLMIPALVPLVRLMPSKTPSALLLLAVSTGATLLVPALFPDWFQAVPAEVSRFISYSHCFVAGLVLSRTDLPRSAALSLIALGLAGLALSALVPAFSEHVGYGLLYTGLVARTLDPTSRISRLLASWHLVWLGERSYSLFLIHFSVIMIVFQIGASQLPPGPTFMLVTRLIAAPLSLFMAMLLFHFVERRFAHGLETGNTFWPRFSPPSSAAQVAKAT